MKRTTMLAMATASFSVSACAQDGGHSLAVVQNENAASAGAQKKDQSMTALKPTTDRKRARWLNCAVVVLLSQAACSAQTTATSPPTLSNDAPPEAAVEAAISRSLQPGEYITEKGWGRLLLSEQGGAMTFSLETITGEDTCGLNGAVQGDEGIAKGDRGASTCTVKFTSTPQGIDVSAITPVECKAFCGYNGDFEASYLRVKGGCGRDGLVRTRDSFHRLYDGKDYKTALATLSPVLAKCLPTLEWEEEGAIRNDLAITQYKNGLYAQCLATLDKYAEDVDKDDDAVRDGFAPVLIDRYLAIIHAARTNIRMCSRNASEKINNAFDGEWTVAWCDKSKPEADCGGFNLGLVQNGSRLCGTYDGARVGLFQIDEGGRVSGTADGHSAVLTIESERSGGKYVAHAVLDGDRIHWKLRETIREADRDIDIIAIDANLDRRSLQGGLASKHAEIAADCQAQWSTK